MVNKEWFKELEEDELWTREYLQELIDKYCSNYYNVVEDITPENVRLFLEAIFKQYQKYVFHGGNLIDIGEALHTYFYESYRDEFPDTFYPVFSQDDKRTLVMNVINYMHEPGYAIMPGDIPKIIEYLHTSNKEIERADKEMENYLRQFNYMSRSYETHANWEAIQQQRAEAEAKGEPEPLEPDKKLMFEILTGKKVPATIAADGYTENIASSLCPEQDYCVTIRYNVSSGEEELDIHKKS